MAGIGFSLKRLVKKKGILNLCRAYGYSSIVTVGPTFLGIFLLLGISFVAKIGGLSDHNRELLNCMLTYSILIALMVTSLFNMVVTRYVSDKIYMGEEEKVMPSFFGSVLIELVICMAVYAVFLVLSKTNPIQALLCLWLSMILIVVWTEMIYMTALRDFQSIVLSFTIALMIGFILALLMVFIGKACIETLLLCVIFAYGLLALSYLKLMLDYFPKSTGSHFTFLSWFDKYPSLAISGFMVRLGLFSHIIIMYFGPLRVQVEGLFYGAPEYDVPALMAFISLLITTVSFVVSVEVNFYPKYSNYYGLFSDKGAIKDIKLAEKEMIDVLRRELIYLCCKQFFATVLFVVVGPPIVSFLFPGISTISLSIFKFLCAAYGIYAIANSLMLIELYFEDYNGALVGTILFAVTSTAATIWQIMYGNVHYFGLGFAAGSAVFYFFALIRLNWYTKRLPYFLLSKQSFLQYKKKGLLTLISKKMEERHNKAEERMNKKVRGEVHV